MVSIFNCKRDTLRIITFILFLFLFALIIYASIKNEINSNNELEPLNRTTTKPVTVTTLTTQKKQDEAVSTFDPSKTPTPLLSTTQKTSTTTLITTTKSETTALTILTKQKVARYAQNGSLNELILAKKGFQEIESDAFVNSKNLKKIDLSFNRIKSIPKNVFEPLENIEYIDLSDNDLLSIPNDLNRNSLKILIFGKNGLKEIPKFINEFNNLEKLDLSNNNLKHLPKDVLNSNLKTLILASNQINSIEYGTFSQLNQIEHVVMTNNFIEQLPKDFFKESIRILELGSNKIKELPQGSLKEMKNLKKLDLSENRNFQIQNEQLPISLKDIRLKKVDMTELSEVLLEQADNLEYIDLSENRLRQLPSNICKNTLRDLYLGNNLIEMLPEKCLNNMKFLKYLNISYNPLTHLPQDSFKQMTLLYHVYLMNTNLSIETFNVTSGSIFGNKPKLTLVRIRVANMSILNKLAFINDIALWHLIITDSDIKEIESDAFSEFSQLKTLDLSFNKLNSLTDFNLFKENKRLTKIRLQSNLIQEVDLRVFGTEELPNESLDELDLSHNKITHLYGNGSQLLALKTLRVNDNSIRQIDNSMFGHMFKLESLFLNHNKIVFITPFTFVNNSYIRDLKLLSNEFNTIEDKAFYGLNGLRILDLRNMKIKGLLTLQNKIIDEIPNIKSFFIDLKAISVTQRVYLEKEAAERKFYIGDYRKA